jgi:peptide/nickel transport system substrate-binding protein
MSNDNPLILSEEPPQPGSAPRPPLRWQWIALGGGLLLIVLAGALTLIPRRPARPADPVVTFVEGEAYGEAIVGEPEWVNPLLAVSQADKDLVALVFSGLTRLDEFGQPIPDLAESWEISADGLTYTVALRDDVTWHDGEPFSAEDVAFTMSLLRETGFPGPADLATFWRTVETYADDEHTVRFVLTQPLAAFPDYLRIGILPAHILAGIRPEALADDPFNLEPVGTGRLRWVSLEEQGRVTRVTLQPYPDFYDPARRVEIGQVDLSFYPNPEDAFRALGDEVQAYGGLAPAQLDAALNSPDLNLYAAPLPVYALLIFNQGDAEGLPFFQEEPVRRALAQALNHQALLEALGRTVIGIDSTVQPGTWAYNPALSPPPYDPAQAEQTLDEAGWIVEAGGVRARDGVRMRFTLLLADRPADREIGQAVAEQWGQIGVDVSLQVADPDDLLERLDTPRGEGRGRDFDAALVEIGQGRLADPDPYPFWHDSQIESGQNYSGFADNEVSRALEVARRDSNGVRRADLYQQFQQLLLDRTAAIPLYSPVYSYAVSCQVQGVALRLFVGPSDRFLNMHEWSLVPQERLADVCPQ